MSAAGWARGRILVAPAFLAWLDERGTTLGAATQADVDDWLDGARGSPKTVETSS